MNTVIPSPASLTPIRAAAAAAAAAASSSSSSSRQKLASACSAGSRRGSMRINASVASPLAEPRPVDLRCHGKAPSLYEILRVNKSASQTEIKTAYRSLAKLCHPDAIAQEESDGRDFIEIHNAYETLSDPTARALYDLSLASSYWQTRRPVGFSGGVYPTRRWETDQCW
uniref:J domain-containing protein n=1 Tax=Rhizophora mucronata TaxID=61149 RepID=A0A2P2PKD9_RHIMU